MKQCYDTRRVFDNNSIVLNWLLIKCVNHFGDSVSPFSILVSTFVNTASGLSIVARKLATARETCRWRNLCAIWRLISSSLAAAIPEHAYKLLIRVSSCLLDANLFCNELWSCSVHWLESHLNIDKSSATYRVPWTKPVDLSLLQKAKRTVCHLYNELFESISAGHVHVAVGNVAWRKYVEVRISSLFFHNSPCRWRIP